MGLEKLYTTVSGTKPSFILYRNKPDQLFVQFQDEGMAFNDFTVDEELLLKNDLHSVYDFEKNINKLPTTEQKLAFEIARKWLLNNS